jgi:predicted RNA-binding protein (virulence factor B family)
MEQLYTDGTGTWQILNMLHILTYRVRKIYDYLQKEAMLARSANNMLSNEQTTKQPTGHRHGDIIKMQQHNNHEQHLVGTTRELEVKRHTLHEITVHMSSIAR